MPQFRLIDTKKKFLAMMMHTPLSPVQVGCTQAAVDCAMKMIAAFYDDGYFELESELDEYLRDLICVSPHKERHPVYCEEWLVDAFCIVLRRLAATGGKVSLPDFVRIVLKVANLDHVDLVERGAETWVISSPELKRARWFRIKFRLA